MDLELLRTFLEVDRTRHFGKAAEALHLTQAAVSARIKLLETTLGVTLFTRARRDIGLTPEGNKLKRYAEKLIADWRKARQDVAIGAENEQLAIGGSPRLWDVLLQDWLADIHRHKPDMAIIAESHTPELLVRRLLDGVLDVGFMLEAPNLENLQIAEVASIQLVLVSASGPVDVVEALNYQYVMVDWGFSHALHHRRLFPDAAEPYFRFSQAKMTLEFIKNVGGAAYLPTRMVAEDVEDEVLFVVSDAPAINRSAYAVYPLRSERKDLIEECLSLLSYDAELPS